MTRPKMRVSTVTISAPNPLALAAFYERLLGWTIARQEGPRHGGPPEDGWAIMRAPSGSTEMSLSFEFDPHYVRPVWPSAEGEQQIMEHLDIAVEDLDEAVAWATEAGATLAEYQPQEHVRVMLDPAGHPFCLFPGPV